MTAIYYYDLLFKDNAFFLIVTNPNNEGKIKNARPN